MAGMKIQRSLSGVFLLWILLLTVSISTQGQSAASVPWAAWLHNQTEGRMTLVNSTGQIDEFILPLPGGFDVYPEQVAVAPDGLHMAYVAGQSGGTGQQLVVYDHSLRAIVATYDPASVGGTVSGMPGFSPDSRRLAFGYALAPQGWEIIIIDLPTFSIADALRYDDPAVQSLAISSIDRLAPSIQTYYDHLIAFVQTPLAMDDTSYQWQLDPRAVTAGYGFGGPYPPDTFPATGETISAHYDDRLPTQLSSMDFLPANTLQVYQPADQTVTPFYHDPGHALSQPHFGWNGALILFQSDANWQIITRDGLPVTGLLPEGFSPLDLAGTPDGWVYLAADIASGSSILHEVTLSSDGGSGGTATDRTVYTLDRPAEMSLAWVGSLGGAPLFTAGVYPAWAQAVPVEAGTPASVIVSGEQPGASATPAPEVLHAGGAAIVSTTNGDSLNLRTAAGVDFQIRAKLARGTEVDVLEGPVEADGFNWWRVRNADGTEGWVADFVDGVVTLLPRQAYESGDTGSEISANPTMLSLLEIGQKAKVTLAAKNDRLRMRNGAGLNFRVIALLPPETLVTVVDGPRVADSLTWWQIRVADGSVGWAAEIIGSERALTATGAVDNSTPVPTHAPAPTLIGGGGDGDMIPPLLVAPFDGSTVNDPALKVGFTWSPVPGAASYTLTLEQCPSDATDDTDCIDIEPITGLSSTAYTITLNQGGTYRWSITAVGSDGVTTSISTVWKFTLNS